MIMLRNSAKFTSDKQVLKKISFSRIRCKLKQSAAVWSSSLTQKNMLKLLNKEYKEQKQNLKKKLKESVLSPTNFACTWFYCWDNKPIIITIIIIIIIIIIEWSLKKIYTGCPKKSVISVWQVIEGIRSRLQTKVGWVLKNSGNFLSDEHKNEGREKQGQTWLPPPKKWDHLGSPCRFFLCP